MTQAKICGLTTPETVAAAVDGGAAFIGFNFFPKSPRYLSPETAARLAPPARAKGVKTVAIVVDPDDETLDAIAGVLQPDLIQLHGSETTARTVEISRRTGRAIIKVLSVRDPSDLAPAKAYEGLVDHLMFDAKPPKGSDLPGGVGARFDWAMLKDKSFSRPHFLAGGLDPWNLSEAVRLSGAPLVDVSSGVERGPGLKDPALISAFLEAVRRA
jgi:phosphoribosylanthranilate isomerase